jgi:acetyl-CoA carboxylase biotin carboxyl carrier protein
VSDDREFARRIVALVAGSSIDELRLEIGDFRLAVRKATVAGAHEEVGGRGDGAAGEASAPPGLARGTLGRREAAAGPGAVEGETGAPAGARPAGAVPGAIRVTAPMIGTFYRAPAPGAPPFVEVGDVVEAGATLCIIEVMKLMNEVRAQRRARVVDILAENAALVEFGQPLIMLAPVE